MFVCATDYEETQRYYLILYMWIFVLIVDLTTMPSNATYF